MSKFNAGQSFADGDTVTGAKLNNITGLLDIYTGLISEQTAIVATVSTADQLLIADTDNGDSGAANRVTVQKLLNDTLTNGTYTNAQLSGNLNVTQLSTLGTLNNTRGTVGILNSTTGTIQSLTSSTANISQGSAIFTQGTIATLNSTTGTIGTLNNTTGTIGTLVATGTITGSTNVVNIGSGQIYKDASGNVGIGVTSPISSIHAKQATPVSKITLEDLSTNRVGQIGGGSDGSGGLLTFSVGNNGGSITEYMRISAAGEVFIAGTTDQGIYNLQVNGTGVWGAGAYVNGSDSRIKEDIQPIASGLDVVEKLNPVTYKYKETWSSDQSIQSGFIAQELLTALDGQIYVAGVVQQGGTQGYYSVAYQNLIPVLAKAIQELKAKNDSLEARLQALEARLQALEAK